MPSSEDIKETCPVCNQKLILMPERTYCNKMSDHQFYVKVDHDENIIISLILTLLGQKTLFKWDMNKKVFSIRNRSKPLCEEKEIQWFYPDFSDYPKLLNKLKTILFCI